MPHFNCCWNSLIVEAVRQGISTTIDNEGILCASLDECVCCGSAGEPLHGGLRDRIFGAPGTWSIRRCTNTSCGLGWLDPQPLPSEIGKLYEVYYTHGGPEEAAAEPLADGAPVDLSRYIARGPQRSARRVLRRLFPRWHLRFDTDLVYLGDRRPGRVLELGCGDGSFMRVLRAAGWEAVGIDFDERAVAVATRNGLDATVADLAGSAFPDASFDAITMGNVIEHLLDPAAVFAECRRILKPGGKLVAVTPNLDSYLHETFGPDWRGLEIPRHLYLYSVRTLERFAKAANYGHFEAFSLKDAPGADFMAAQSKVIAARSGRSAPQVDAAAADRKASRLRWLGISRAEWVILVAEK